VVKNLAALLLLAVPARALDFPEPRGYVNDFAGVLDAGDSARLEGELKGLDSAKGIQIAVATVPDLQGADPETFAGELYRKWGIGKKGSDKGVLFLVAVKERKARIEPGYGLEGVLPDGLCGRILRDHSVPYFKEGRWSPGIVAGVEAVVARLSGDGRALPEDDDGREGASPLVLLILIVFVVIAVALRSRYGPPPSSGWRRRSRWDDGWSSGGFSGGGGFGGFGGGSSGGGGATASW
jgi:uncharacterized protein